MTSVYWGSSVVPIAFVEVTPLVVPKSTTSADQSVEENPPKFSNFSVQQLLQTQTRRSLLLSLSGKNADHTQMTPLLVEWTNETSSRNVTTDPSTSKNNFASGYLYHDIKPELYRVTLLQLTDTRGTEMEESTSNLPICFLPCDDPAVLEDQPCLVKVYAPASTTAILPIISEDTLIRVLPCCLAVLSPPDEHDSFITTDTRNTAKSKLVFPAPPWYVREMFLQRLLGECCGDRQLLLTDEQCDEVIGNHNPETIQELKLQLSMQASQPVRIGTTHDAISCHRQAINRRYAMKQAIQTYCQTNGIPLTTSASSKSTIAQLGFSTETWSENTWEDDTLLPSSSLIVHSPNHSDGKTWLVQAIATKHVGCERVHVIRSGPLLAKYGIYADAALETMLHELILSAAVRDQAICIILDQLDLMLPPRLSGRSGAGDATVPIWNAIASYLRNVTTSLQRLKEFPFPIKNQLYNVNGTGGMVLSVRLCLVGIVTCPDDGWRSVQQENMSGSSTILDVMLGRRYRLPSLTAKTRWTAFCNAFDRVGLQLQDEAKRKLPLLAASAAWAKGSSFQRVANILLSQLQEGDDNDKSGENGKISMSQLENAFSSVKAKSATFAKVSFQPQTSQAAGNDSTDLFASVGGNVEAKQAMEDAMALDPIKRRMLERFGFSPPIGVLLYGPPGCGKTLLAKAVASLLGAPSGDGSDSTSLGGTFLSMGASDLVRAEIGTSEKMLVSAFEFADKNAPSVIFLDEFQALFTERSRGGSGRLASTLLQCLDSVRQRQKVDSLKNPEQSNEDTVPGNRVIVLGATNTPWMVDKAFLRPGRFDRVVHVGLPTLQERQAILMVHAREMRLADTGDDTSLERLCQALAQKTDGFSGADLAALCRAAAIQALIESGKECDIHERHFNLALEEDVIASSDAKLVARLQKWKP